ncbi:hypothetical protein PHYBOEH_010200 [Phytophthora boehmeriae]|uniref:Uncharacterized protein n=1 Tax=Phytophthora boehmeriae TaxID=109152 RepID=A0A8T1WZJ6_9STRA|nr:hypothetical protein PHYBOEH_010200 [Phytophthora boehmeriae]
MHGLQQASSFFPTAKELSSGVQWFKDHPVLAAAAATAVSVITYLNALELSEGDGQKAEDNVELPSQQPLSASRRSLSRKSSGHASDGKLSAAVSWCDEHGGSLTQVFEDETPQLPARARRDDSESDSDDVAESVLEPFGHHHRALPTGLRKSVTTHHLQDCTGGSTAPEENDAAQTQSPQWGWYVPITPPQDQFIQSTTAGRESEVVLRRSFSGHIP